LTSDELARLGDALHEGGTMGLPYFVDEAKPAAKHARKAEHRRPKLDSFAVAANSAPSSDGRAPAGGQRARRDLSGRQQDSRKPIYLSAAAQAVLAAIPRVTGNAHIIAGAREGAPAPIKGGKSRRRPLRILRRRRIAGPSHYRQIAWPIPSRQDSPLCAPGRRRDAHAADIHRQLGHGTSPAVVYIDTLNRSLVGSESFDEDMAAYIRATDAIRDTFDCLVVIVYHCGHGGDRPRGHSSLAHGRNLPSRRLPGWPK
jgi:AAA domain